MIEQASLVIGEGNWAVKSDSLLGYKINGGKYYPREMSVVRSTTGTRINEDGLVELVPYNLFQYSEDFTKSFWTKSNTTVTANTTISPSGTLTADTMSTSVGTSRLTGNVVTGAGTYTISCYVKRLTGNDNFQFRLVVDGSNQTQIFTVTDEWQRFSFTVTAASSITSPQLRSAGTGTGTFAIWGAQLVEGSTALDYLPTTDRLDVARIDYSSGSGALLVEPQRTNLVTYSSSFDNSAWNKTNCSITANNTTAPDGTTAADKLILANGQSGSSSDGTGIRQLVDIASGSYTYSIYAKAAEFTTIRFREIQVTGAFLTIDLTNGAISTNAIGAGQYINPTATLVSNGWYRITFQTPTLTALYKYSVRVSETGNGTSGIFIWGYQVELGSYSTSYIPTQAATVTRNADLISKTGITDLIGQTEGTLFLDFVPQSKDFQIFYQVRTTGSTNVGQIDIRYQSSNLRALGNDNGTTQFTISAGDIVIGQRYKCAVRYQLNNVAFYVNGALVGTDLSATFASSSKDQVAFCDNLGNFIPQAEMNAAVLWNTALTNDELATLTTI